MVATNLPRPSMQSLLTELQKLLPETNFEAGETFFWSPVNNSVTYKSESTTQNHQWALLHEAAHALLGHSQYKYDVELLLLEVEAWHKAKELGQKLNLSIDEEHVQDCLDTYRDWLHQRSTCPRCSTVSLQVSPQEYRCHNCFATWGVSNSRFCRPYRSSKQHKKSPEAVLQTTFQ